MGISTEQLNDMMKAGGVIAKDSLPKFSKELRNAAKEGGAFGEGTKTIAAAQNRLNIAFTEAVDVFSMAGGKAGFVNVFDAMSQSLETLKPTFFWIGQQFEKWSETLKAIVQGLNFVLNAPVALEKFATGDSRSVQQMIDDKIKQAVQAKAQTQNIGGNKTTNTVTNNANITINAPNANAQEVYDKFNMEWKGMMAGPS